MNIDISRFASQLDKIASETSSYIRTTAPRIAANVALKAFRQNFQDEGFFSHPWKQVLRRTSGTKAYRYNAIHHPARLTRRILTGDSGDLGRSLSAQYHTSSAIIFSDKVYARVHNQGLRAGRGKGFTMPRRQFMGDDPALDSLIIDALTRKYSQLINK